MNAVPPISIDKNVPLPAPSPGRAHARACKWPWTDMQPGDSFFAAGYVQTRAQGRGKTIGLQWAKKLVPGSKWASRYVTENGVSGVRVWRVA